MTYEKIKTVADALCVDIRDLGAPETERVDIQKITGQLQDALASLPTTRLLKKKTETITALLSQTDDRLTPCISYIIHDSNHLGRSCACYVLSSTQESPGSPQPEFQADVVSITALDWYRKKKGIKKNKLASMVSLSRPTLNLYLNGKKEPDPELIQTFAHILGTDPFLLAQDYAPALICRDQLEKALLETLKTCRPQTLKARQTLLLTYLNQLDPDMEHLLSCLMLPSSTKKEEVISVLQDMMGSPLFYRRHYKPRIHIGYCRDEDDDHYHVMVLFDKDMVYKNLSFLDLLKDLLSNKELLHMILSDENFSDKLLSALDGAMEELGENYKIQLRNILSNHQMLREILSDNISIYKTLSDKILLNGTVYPLLGLSDPHLYFSAPDASGLPAIHIDFPYEIESEHSPDDSEFEFDLLDQAMDAFLYDVTDPDSDPALTEIFLDHLDKCCENPDIVEYPAHDLSQYIRQRQQEQKYKQIAAKIYEKSSDIPGFIDAIAWTFSLIKEDPEYERRIFTEYGLETE